MYTQLSVMLSCLFDASMDLFVCFLFRSKTSQSDLESELHKICGATRAIRAPRNYSIARVDELNAWLKVSLHLHMFICAYAQPTLCSPYNK